MTQVLVVMGSDSDFPAMKSCVKMLDEFGVTREVRVCSAHRTPDALVELIHRVEGDGCQVIIAAAGVAAHLAGVCAAHSMLPVIGVPMEGGALHGVDSLYSTVQMPPGVPVATMGIGAMGAKNAGLFAVEILARADTKLRDRYAKFREKMAREVAEKDARLQKEL